VTRAAEDAPALAQALVVAGFQPVVVPLATRSWRVLETADVAAANPDADWVLLTSGAVVDVLVAKTRRAARDVGAKGLVLAGGVAANSLLRERVLQACIDDGMQAFLPSREMCTDNAAMIASAGWFRLRSDGPTSLAVGAFPNLRLPLLDA
jgi:N6-L-threonylcarbamoyladenine synthase